MGRGECIGRYIDAIYRSASMAGGALPVKSGPVHPAEPARTLPGVLARERRAVALHSAPCAVMWTTRWPAGPFSGTSARADATGAMCATPIPSCCGPGATSVTSRTAIVRSAATPACVSSRTCTATRCAKPMVAVSRRPKSWRSWKPPMRSSPATSSRSASTAAGTTSNATSSTDAATPADVREDGHPIPGLWFLCCREPWVPWTTEVTR